MTRLYIIIAILSLVMFAILKWRGVSTGKGALYSGIAFLVLAGLVTLLFVWGGDKPTPGARTVSPEELRR